ncbi:cyclic pyranopterin monophosphate synthase MoaC [Pseudoalteromonas sp. S4741]|uniref:cyclic pyranopterin monophosphate synthase MoaC n=1 Tax=Pseudoalteromonas sp. S4741 TaxID=579563 RepID=UPI00110AA1A1|nr:cyclic pyranopterin monophosphate synthase MoaC [Pseudoalteromonas sp. S4741]TMO28193.1 cyclic pyranopterin monophosphate synthase MoaC [Pseudoalteromonas sp. S4741]
MLTHLNAKGQANMVDVSDKVSTQRSAQASGCITMNAETLAAVCNNQNKKGDVLATARIAGIQAAKKCADLIPLCHPLALTKIDIDFEIDTVKQQIKVSSLCKLNGQTGVEMEALTAVSVALLTLFDMCKAGDPSMTISEIKVLTKAGGKTGLWQRTTET